MGKIDNLRTIIGEDQLVLMKILLRVGVEFAVRERFDNKFVSEGENNISELLAWSRLMTASANVSLS